MVVSPWRIAPGHVRDENVDEIRVRIRNLSGSGDELIPRYMTEHASGMDLCAAVAADEIIRPGGRKAIPTGIEIELPPGFEAQIRPRSGLALRYGVTILNTPGTIDADYRGEIRIIMINHGEDSFTVKRGDRIAQMVVQPVCRVSWHVSERLDNTERGAGGFGHTG